jgi:CheY-like chemotaxis protein
MNAVNGSRVLLAEDNEMNQELAIELLNNAGIQVVLAQDGNEALQILETDHSFDAILMDCQMPVMDGYQATEILRKRPGLAGIPVIAMTADVMDTDKEKAIRAGMVDHIVKPINVGQMFATLAKWITTKNAVQAQPQKASIAETGNEVPAIPGFDTAKGLATVMGNRTLYLRQLQRFHDSYCTFEADFAQASLSPDQGLAIRTVHSLRGNAGNLGAMEVQGAAGRLEQALKSIAPIEQQQALRRALTEVLQPAIAALKSIKPPQEAAQASSAQAGAGLQRSQLEQLAQQLARGDAQASDHIAAMLANCPIGATHVALTQIARKIEDFDFEAAESRVNLLLRDWEY